MAGYAFAIAFDRACVRRGGLSAGKPRRRLGWLAALVLLGYLYNAAACLEVAVIHSLEIRRYFTVQMYLTLLAQFFAMWFVLEFALEMRACDKIIIS